jgi:hypothetical protein
MARHEFTKPITFEGTEYTGLDLDLDRLTGKDLINIEAEMTARGIQAVMPEISKSYQMLVAARAAKVPVELIEELPIKDASAITMKVVNFLFGSA